MGVHVHDLFPFNLLMNAFLSSNFWIHYELVVRYHWHRYRLVFSSLREANWDKISQGVTAEWNMRFWMSKPGVMILYVLWMTASLIWLVHLNQLWLFERKQTFAELFWQVFLIGFDVWFWSTLLVCIYSLDWQDYVRCPKIMCYNV